ncbi:MAG: hypothetical protein K2K57_05475 [Oscillospiraceae bacterium]|nr:hypothetical protein [Oscillospiraceae bacterium]
MVTWTNKEDEAWEGEFKSRIFHGEDDDNLIVYIENPSAASHAARCAAFLNEMPQETVNLICEKIVAFEKTDKDNTYKDFKMPELENPIDVLKYCWFAEAYVSVPKDEKEISFCVEGEAEWGDNIGFVIENGKLVYVGNDAVNYYGKMNENAPGHEAAPVNHAPQNNYEEEFASENDNGRPRIRFKKSCLIYLAVYILFVILIVKLGGN